MASVYGSRPYVAPAAPVPASVPAEESVIAVEATVSELTPEEIAHRLRYYAAAALAMCAALILLKMAVVLYRRWREENVATVRSQPADRHSLRRARKQLI